MVKQTNDKLLFISIFFLLALVFIFLGFNTIDNPFISDSIVRLLYSSIIFIILWNLKFDIFKPFRKPHGFKILLLALPALMISLNNFPIIAYLNGQTSITSDVSIASFALQCLTVGLFEELLFRGLFLSYLLDYLKDKKHYVFKAMIISSLIFGLSHLLNIFSGASIPATLLQVLYTMLTGLLWSAVFILTKNIWVVVMLHAIYNFAGLLYPTMGQVNGQFDLWTIIITIFLSFIVAAFYLMKLIKIKQIHIKKEI